VQLDLLAASLTYFQMENELRSLPIRNRPVDDLKDLSGGQVVHGFLFLAILPL
jgi:hypothetical protein